MLCLGAVRQKDVERRLCGDSEDEENTVDTGTCKEAFEDEVNEKMLFKLRMLPKGLMSRLRWMLKIQLIL